MKIRQKLFKFFLFIKYKQWFLLLKYMEKNGVEVIVVDNVNWLNEKHTETKLGHSNLAMMTLKYPKHLKKKKKKRIDKM